METKIINNKNQKNSLKQQVVEVKKGFKVNLTAYLVVTTMLFIINVLTLPNFLWCLFPLCGWGFGVTMHYYFGVRSIAKKSEI